MADQQKTAKVLSVAEHKKKKGEQPEALTQAQMSWKYEQERKPVVIDRATEEPAYWHPERRGWIIGKEKLAAEVTGFCEDVAADMRHPGYPAGFCSGVAQLVHREAIRRAVWKYDGTEFNGHRLILGLPNGRVYDFYDSERKVRNADMTDHVTMKTSVEPEQRNHPEFAKFLWQLTCGRQELYDFLWALMGYTVVGGGREEIAILLKGQGADGKGTLIGVLTDILGDYSTLLQPDFFKDTAARRHLTEMAELDRKRLWANPESADGKWVVQRFKTMTGERQVMANRMRRDPQPVHLDGVLWAGVNKTPMLDGGHAMARRLVVIPCDLRLEPHEMDPSLKERLRSEYPAILHEIAVHAVKYLDGGLPPVPECVREESAVFLKDAAPPLDAWLKERCVEHEHQSETAAELYADCKQWHEDAGHHAPSATLLGRFLTDAGFPAKQQKDRVSKKTTTMRLGIRLKPQ